jgi:proline utilization trans-activator
MAAASMAPETLLSSTDAFGSEIRTLVSSRPRPGSSKTTPAATSAVLQEFDVLENVPGWPSEDEANSLLELVVLQVGLSQQLFDVRAFSDSLSRLYQNPRPVESLSSIWITEALLVMAIGRLLAAKTDEPSGIPGESFYNAALRRLPQPGDVKKHGITGIEVVALTALYLQIADRKEEAYIYVSA